MRKISGVYIMLLCLVWDNYREILMSDFSCDNLGSCVNLETLLMAMMMSGREIS